MKNKIRLVLLLAFLVFVSVYYGGNIKKNTLGVSNTVIDGFLSVKEYIKFKIDEHINQKNEIQHLREENKQLNEYKALYIAQSSKLNKLLDDKNSTNYEPRVHLSRVLTYLEIGDFSKLFIDYKNIDKNKIYGLIYNARTIGIAKNHLGKSLAIIQGDPKCTFSVYIGNSLAPGIVSGDGDKMIVRFIPKWIKIQTGDNVITSGLDGIFFYGIDVGRVVSVSEDEAYQSAIIKPYNAPVPPSFVYVVEKSE